VAGRSHWQFLVFISHTVVANVWARASAKNTAQPQFQDPEIQIQNKNLLLSMQTCRSNLKSLSIFSRPAHRRQRIIRIETGRPVSSRMGLVQIFSSAAAPVSTIAASLMFPGEKFSGGRFAPGPRARIQNRRKHSLKLRGFRCRRSSPVRGILRSGSAPSLPSSTVFQRIAEPISILICSAVRSGHRLYLRFRYCHHPLRPSRCRPTRTERSTTMPLIEMTAMSVVPPPMSTTMLPDVLDSAGRPLRGHGCSRKTFAGPRAVRGVLHGALSSPA